MMKLDRELFGGDWVINRKIVAFFLLFVFLAGCASQNKEKPPTTLATTPEIINESVSAPPPPPPFYGRTTLAPTEVEVYDLIVAGLSKRPFSDKIPIATSLSKSQLEKVGQLLYYDHPEFYWADFSIQMPNTGYELQVRLKDVENIQQVDRQLEALSLKAEEILQPTKEMSDYEKLIFIHDYLATTVVYDYGFKIQYSGTAYGSLIDKVGYCDGFTRGFQYLAQRAGLTQVYLQGWDLKGTTHAWNGVNTEKGWLYTDTTWDRYSNDYGGAYHNFAAMTLNESLMERQWDEGQYPTLPSSLAEGHSYYYFKDYTVNLNTTPKLSDSIPRLSDIIQRQLQAHKYLTPQYEYAFLELEVIGSPEEYAHWKNQFMQEVFTVLAQTQQALEENTLPFSIQVSSTVSCHFNDSMQIVSFYPMAKYI